METFGSRNKLIGFVEKWIIPVTLVVYLVHYSILKHWFDGAISDMKTYLMVLIGILFVINFCSYVKQNGIKKLPYSKWTLLFLVLYFALRCITVIKCDFNYGVIKEVFYEGIFLIAISQFTVTEKMDIRTVALWFVICVAIMNILNDISYAYYYVYYYEDTELMNFIWDIGPDQGIIYTNSNTGGILTGISLLLSLIFTDGNRKNLKWIIPYWCLGILSLGILFARSSYVAFAAALLAIVVMMVFKRINPKTLVVVSMIAAVCVTGGICGYIMMNNQNGNSEMTAAEYKLDTVTSGRYHIWEDVLNSHKGEWTFGLGSYELEMDDRNEYMLEKHLAAGGSENDFEPTIFHIHNAYIGVFVYAGMLAGALFFFLMGNKIINAPVFRQNRAGRWMSVILASILIYIFCINIVEPYFIGKRHIEFFLILVIMAWNMPEKGASGQNAADR